MSKSENSKIGPNIYIDIPNSKEEFVDLEGRDIIRQKYQTFNETCSICHSKITDIKYICIICTDCVLCSKCEEIHIHPVLKCKSYQLSTLKDVYIYINKRNKVIKSLLKNEKDSSVLGLFQDIFIDKYEIKLSTPYTQFTMRPNKSITIPITIQNLSNNIIECSPLDLFIYAKNTKDLKVYTKKLEQTIHKKEQLDIDFLVESNNHCDEYNFVVELYSSKNIKLKCNILELKVIVNDDEEEEKLNEYFEKYPKIILASKETKNCIKKILKENNIQEDPITIMQFLKNNDNDLDKTIKNLTSMNDFNKNMIK